MEKILRVNGMTCGHCKASVEGVVSKLDGVDSVDVDLDSKEVKVAGDGFNDEAIRAAIEEIGFEVE